MLEVPTNPCEGCRHRELGPVAHNPRTHRDALTTICQLRAGTLYRVWWGDELPKWCPGKEPK